MFKITRDDPLRTQYRTRRLSSIGIAGVLGLLIAVPALSAGGQNKKPKQEQQQQSEDDAVRLHSDLVVVNLIVTDAKGQYAHGLREKDFTIFEDDRAQPINTFFSEEAPFAAAILIDTSGSMDYKFGLARAAAASFVDHIRENDQVAVYGFNNEIKLFQDFSDLHDISEYIWDAKAENMTRMYDCLFEALTALDKRSEKRKAILVISDGWDTTSAKATFGSVMKKALADGVTIYSVDLIDDSTRLGSSSWSVELRRGMAELRELAAQTGGRYIHSPQGDKLEEEFTNVVDELRNQYTVTYYSTNSKRDGRWRKLGVGVSRQGLTTRTRKGYWAPKG
ncbi:MAG TPA: VWA domain-containing protein [Blastocatellia bacterium]|nr:VWA domain-containing protein [Blastocatellia bacterium]